VENEVTFGVNDSVSGKKWTMD